MRPTPRLPRRRGPALIALLFPGQGAQQVGMGRALAEAFPIARRTFEEANDVLGYDLARICFEGPHEDLMCHAALPAGGADATRWRPGGWRASTASRATSRWGTPWASTRRWWPAGALASRRRCAWCRRAATPPPTSSAAPPGADGRPARRQRRGRRGALRSRPGEVWPANYNCPGQVVASGLHRGVDRLLDLAHARGIKAQLLDVDGAFHSSVMAPAAEKLREALVEREDLTPSLPFLSATSARVREGRAPALAAGPAAHGAGALHPDRAHGPRPRRRPLRRVRPPARAGGPRAAHPPRRQGGQPRATRRTCRPSWRWPGASAGLTVPVALVTGASKGIGAACAVALARRGYDVGLTYATDRAGAEAVAAAACGAGGRRAHGAAAEAREPGGVGRRGRARWRRPSGRSTPWWPTRG